MRTNNKVELFNLVSTNLNMSNIEGFTSILGVFFAAFHPEEGTKILCQVPEKVVNIETTSIDDILLKDRVLGLGGHKKSKVSLATHESEDDRLLSEFGSMVLNNYNEKPMEDYSRNDEGLINFDDIRNVVIPKPEFCNRLLSAKAGKYKVIGYPVNIQEPFYARNSFNFNFCFIFDYDSDSTCYEPVVRRLGKMFKVLEEQSQILSKSSNDLVYFNIENKDIKEYISERDLNYKYFKILNAFRPDNNNNHIDNGIDSKNSNLNINKSNNPFQLQDNKNAEFSIENLIQQIYQDLNNYSECSIKINAGNSIDIKLFPNIKLPDINILPCDVPISTVNLDSLVDFYWDPNLLRMTQYINGVNNINKIAKLCNSDYDYTCLCIRHLMAYKCIILLDTFSFQNIYATTSKVSMFLDHNKVLGEECKRYCYSGKDTNPLKNLAFKFMEKRNDSFVSENASINTEAHSTRSADFESRGNPIRPDAENMNNKHDGENGQQNYSYESVMNNVKNGYITNSFDSLNQSGSTTGLNYSDSKDSLSTIQIFQLYTAFQQGRNVEEWYRKQENLLRGVNIDIRRFITYGLLQGLLYRIYSYPMLVEYNSKWLSRCKVYYILKDQNYIKELNRKFTSVSVDVRNKNTILGDNFSTIQQDNSAARAALQKEIDQALDDEEYMKRFNDSHNIKPVSKKQIIAKKYNLVEFKTTIFPKPGTHRDSAQRRQRKNLDATAQNSTVGGGASGSFFNDINSQNNGGSINNMNTQGYEYSANKLSLQKFKNPNYIKLISGKSSNGEEEFYSLTSILTMKKHYLDKIKHFDLICTDFEMSRKEVEKVLKCFWKFHVVER
ncbi:nitrogen permease regulating protein [Saccharomycopsis crataegensis]|uniref:Nitrogen permease regulating protein n=1 Tax=Saccharomycopsis crataegensis TaxID=43959 RepID=A0AAV5QDH2_9ASCO|nr:nitrogen permease regulating protein [Saccharomycopsis crataegensis]